MIYFTFLEDFVIASYEDDTTIYIVNQKEEPVVSALETSSSLLFELFDSNFMKANCEKSYIMMNCREATIAIIDGLFIESSEKEVLLRMTIDNNYQITISTCKLQQVIKVQLSWGRGVYNKLGDWEGGLADSFIFTDWGSGNRLKCLVKK